MKKILALGIILWLLPTSNVFAEPCAADISCDGNVNLSDLVTMKAEFLNTGCDPCMCNPIYNCPAGMIDCNGICIDPMTDRGHCGAMPGCIGGSECGAGEICDSGMCVLTCQPGLIKCGAWCVDTQTNENHCGGCGNPCGSGLICISGSCEIAGTVIYEAAVPKTGQTTSYATGDDGDLEEGVAWPNPRFTNNLDGTITDNLTGLIWLKEANCIETNYPGFDNDYTAGDGKVTWQHGLDFVAGINDGTYPNCGAGASDWRLPNRRELFSLIDDENYSPALPSGHPFTNVQSSGYWSSTTYAYDSDDAWYVFMGYGYLYNRNKTYDFYVWPVRGGQ